MFSEEWNLQELDTKADKILEKVINQGLAKYISVPELNIKLPASINVENNKYVMIVCSGYPEHAGVWSYTLLEESRHGKGSLKKISMECYFQEIPEQIGIVVMNPHAEKLEMQPHDSIAIYVSQLKALCRYLTQSKSIKLLLMGYSLGGEGIIQFLQQNPDQLDRIHKLILIDPTPPSLGRRKLAPKVLELVDHAFFYGLCDQEGKPGEFAELTKMRLKITPHLIPCDLHGAMPNLVWPLIQKDLQTIID
ncbi:MAG: hypothetical protein HQM14_05135 [SAR324 cluster bacterium]|nr:hypothetical protein [SAR324 cluster bacterium]